MVEEIDTPIPIAMKDNRRDLIYQETIFLCALA
jgi:hypothetical protein